MEFNSLDATNRVSHQGEAVDYVVRRETLNSPVSRSLWELENSTKDFQWSVKPSIFMTGKLLGSR
jgi:hypothetical protein